MLPETSPPYFDLLPCLGGTADLRVDVSNASQITWQTSGDGGVTWLDAGGGGFNPSFTFDITAETNGTLVRVVVTNGCGSLVSASTIVAAAEQFGSVTLQPVDAVACVGSTVSFAAAVTGATTPPEIEWRRSGESFDEEVIIPGATSEILTFTATAADDGRTYWAVFSSACGPHFSERARLTIVSPPPIVVTTQPQDRTATRGTTAAFTANATGATSFRWQFSADGGSTFENLPEADATPLTTAGTTLSYVADASDDGKRFRCLFANTCGDLPSSAAQLTVAEAIEVAASASTATVCAGGTVALAASASGGDGGETFTWSPATGLSATSGARVQATVAQTTTYTVTAHGPGGSAAAATVTVTVPPDTTPPTLMVPANIVTSTDPGTCSRVVEFSASATDDCAATLMCTPPSGSTFAKGTTTVVCTAADGAGNTAMSSFTITVEDHEAPSITTPPSVTISVGASSAPAATGEATAADPCGTPMVSFADAFTPAACGGGSILRTWTATDGGGNSSSATQTITVVDDVPPVLTVLATAVVEAPGDTSPAATGAATAVDGASGDALVVFTDAETHDCGASRTITRTWTATDACGNAASATQTISVVDTRGPALTLPPDSTVEVSGDTTPAATAAATATDASGVVTMGHQDAETPGCGGSRTIARTWTATDACGRSSSGTQTIAVVDTTLPALTVPADRTVELGLDTTPAAMGAATATDAGGGVTIGHTDVEAAGCGASRTITRTWAATDACGNVATALQTIAVVDTTPPSIQAPDDAIVEYPGDVGPDMAGDATATDTGGSVWVDHQDTETAGCGPSRTITRTWTAVDACGNSAFAIQTIAVVDLTSPALFVPADATIPYGVDASPVAQGAATGFDASGAVAIDHADAIDAGCGHAAVIRRTWTGTDACGQLAYAVQTITVTDLSPPALTVPADATLAFPGDTSIGALGSATAADPDGIASLEYADEESIGLGTRTIARTWTAADACGNAARGVQTITVTYNPPAIAPRPDIVVMAPPGEPAAVVLYAVPAATDAADPSPTVECVPPSGSLFALGATTVQCTATDATGLTATTTFTVTVLAADAPVVIVPGATAELRGGTARDVVLGAGASILVDGTLVIASGGTLSGAGTIGGPAAAIVNDGTVSPGASPGLLSVVGAFSQTTAGRLAIELGGTARGASYDALDVSGAADLSGAVDVTLLGGFAPAAGTEFIVVQAGDLAGDIALGTAPPLPGRAWALEVRAHDLVLVVKDLAAPAIDCPGDLTLEATSAAGAVATFPVSASDGGSDPSPVVTATPASGATFPLGRTDVKIDAHDASGNTSHCAFAVTVRDTTPPAVSVPANIASEATGPLGAAVTFSVSATDLVDGATGASASPPSGWTFPLGTTAVTATRTDAHGNTGSASFTVTVRDTTPPVVSVPASLTLAATSPAGAVATFSVSAADIVDGLTDATAAPPSGSTFPKGTTTVTATRTDAHGNPGSATFTVTVSAGGDVIPPALFCEPIVTAEATSIAGAVVQLAPVATDAGDPHPVVTTTPASGSVFPIGDTLVTASARDASGNESTCSFTVRVEARTLAVSADRATVHWHADQPRRVDVHGTVALPDGAPPAEFRTGTSAPARVVVRLAGAEVLRQDFTLAVRDPQRERWEFKAAGAATGLTALRFDWKDLPYFDSRSAGEPPALPRIFSLFIGSERSTIQVDSKNVPRPFALDLDGLATLRIDALGKVTTVPAELVYRATGKRAETVILELPWRLEPDQVLRVTGSTGATTQITVTPQLNYFVARGNFELKARFAPGALAGVSLPRQLSVELTIGRGPVMRGTLMIGDGGWSRADRNHWALGHPLATGDDGGEDDYDESDGDG
jgi:hypothetical protein